MSVRSLDFAVIGAQKCATTSLRMHLGRHPDVCLPHAGEVPFFSSDTLYGLGWEKFARREFSHAQADSILGKVSSHYMMDERVPARICALMPGIKLVAILRDPADRAFSHYMMCVRRGDEKRSFRDAVNDLLLHADPLAGGGSIPPRRAETRMYLNWGMYGRILEKYLGYFSREQILVVFAEEMANRPRHVMKTIFGFIGADPDVSHGDFCRRYHTRKGEESLRRVKKNPFIYGLSRVVPPGLRPGIRTVASAYLNGRADEIAPEDMMDREIRDALVTFFEEDVELLADMFSLTVPWKGFFHTIK